jgi:hypothetical protein
MYCGLLNRLSMVNLILSTDWAAQNGQLESLSYLLANFDVDVLSKNEHGRSTLTDAFDSGNTDVVAACLTHPSASEENLLKTENNDSANTENTAVTHEFDFDSLQNPSSNVRLHIRELPISRADNPFGSETAPEDDTTGTITLNYK